MGYGDDLLVTKIAASEKKKYPNRQIVIGNIKKNNASHSIVYDNNPNIADCRKLDKSIPIHLIDYHPENRPYIDYKNSLKDRIIWNNHFKPTPGEIYFTDDAKAKQKAAMESGGPL